MRTDGIAGTGQCARQPGMAAGAGRAHPALGGHRIETGQHGTYLRNSLQLKFQLQPALTLDTGVELRRDSEVTGRNQTDAKLNLRCVF